MTGPLPAGVEVGLPTIPQLLEEQDAAGQRYLERGAVKVGRVGGVALEQQRNALRRSA
jgi:hypothetical protein